MLPQLYFGGIHRYPSRQRQKLFLTESLRFSMQVHHYLEPELIFQKIFDSDTYQCLPSNHPSHQDAPSLSIYICEFVVRIQFLAWANLKHSDLDYSLIKSSLQHPSSATYQDKERSDFHSYFRSWNSPESLAIYWDGKLNPHEYIYLFQ